MRQAARVTSIRTEGTVPVVRPPIGRGRSGEVFLDTTTYALPAAAKAFVGDPLADAVHLLLSGAPNPYRWSEDAVRAAFWRRQIIADLVRYWLPDRLEVAEPLGVAWNPEARAWELHARFAHAFPTALHHPFSAARDGEQVALRDEVMRPLQRFLRRAGFDGLAWQAGLGNPVAANNFLVNERRTRPGTPPGPRWTWIDLESGVPALFPLDPRPLLSFYLPRSLRNRRALFDDVDLQRLETYLDVEAGAIRERLGNETLERVRDAARQLARHQQRWHALGRLRAGVEAAVATGKLEPSRAQHYLDHPLRWQVREMTRGARRVWRGLTALPALARRMATRLLDPWLARSTVRFLISHQYRVRVARLYALGRVRHWRHRRQITSREASWLRRVAHREDQATYLSDFAVHLAMKPFYKGASIIGLPLLAQAGLIPLWAVPVGLLAAGPGCRSLYTGLRVLQCRLRRRRAPWMALLVGLIPIAGSAAFPAQIVRSSRGRDGKLAGLILYDFLTSLGRKVPIWGGADTATEHWFNRLADRIVTDRQPLVAGIRALD